MPADDPNVALVVLDTLRKDAFDRHFDWLPGLRFEHAYSPADFTTPAHGSLFTGRYPTEHGAQARRKSLSPALPTLAERLSERGYRTRCLTANPNVSREYGFVRGFEEIRRAWTHDDFADLFDWSDALARRDSLPAPLRYAAMVRDCVRSERRTLRSLRHGLAWTFDAVGDGTAEDKGARSVLETLDALSFDDREFLFLNLMEVHDPYVAPDDYLPGGPVEKPSIADQRTGDVATEEAERVREAYDACTAYLSDTYRGIFTALQREFDYVVTTSDHGHCLGDDGVWGHGYGVYPEVVHVPLSVWRSVDEHTGTDVTASLLDVHRTVLDLAGAPPGDTRGQNLLDGPSDRPRLTEFHGLYANRLDALREAGFDEEELSRYDAVRRGVAVDRYYGCETPEGFRERNPERGPDDPRVVVEELVDDLADPPPDEGGDVSPELRRRLADLGYR